MIRLNQVGFDGYMSFFLLLTIFIVFVVIAQKTKDQPLNNVMYSAAACSILSLIMRSITADIDGVVYPLLNDYFMWIFPVITVVLAAVAWATKK